MARKDAFDQPQAIQHRPFCGVSRFPFEAIRTIPIPLGAAWLIHGHRVGILSIAIGTPWLCACGRRRGLIDCRIPHCFVDHAPRSRTSHQTNRRQFSAQALQISRWSLPTQASSTLSSRQAMQMQARSVAKVDQSSGSELTAACVGATKLLRWASVLPREVISIPFEPVPVAAGPALSFPGGDPLDWERSVNRVSRFSPTLSAVFVICSRSGGGRQGSGPCPIS